MLEGLTERQRRFCLEYLKDGNGIRSAKAAGYSTLTSEAQSYTLLKNPLILAFLNEQREKIESEKIMQAKEIQEKLTAMARGEVEEECLSVVSYVNADYVNADYDEDEEDGKRQLFTDVKKSKKQIVPKDRLKALDTLAKIQRLYNENPNTAITINIIPTYD